MKKTKEDIIVLGLALVLVFIILGIGYIMLFSVGRKHVEDKKNRIFPTSVPTKIPETPTDSPNPDEETVPAVQYDQKSSDLLLERVENRPSLSDEDVQAKAKILAPIKGESGYVYQTERVYIEYVKSADAIMVEIRTSNIDQAKSEATLWLQTQGMTQEGICNYPVQFYLNFDVAQYLRNSNITFSPLAPGCEKQNNL